MKMKSSTLILVTILLVSLVVALSFSVNLNGNGGNRIVKVGMLSDLHWMSEPLEPYDWVVDAHIQGETWTRKAIAEWEVWGADFAIQMGDYCHDIHENGSFCTAAEVLSYQAGFFSFWRSDQFPCYNVFGNHENAYGPTKTQALELWQIPENPSVAYYSFDVENCHFIVLDNQDFEGPRRDVGENWRIGSVQKTWLINDLDSNPKPTFIFIHVPLAGIFEYLNSTWGSYYNSLRNGAEIRTLLESYPNVVAVFQGHYHNRPTLTDDAWHWQDGRIHYFGMPSMIDFNSANARGFLTINLDKQVFTYEVKVEPGLTTGCYYQYPFSMIIN